MNLNYDYFYSLTPRVFFNIQNGYNQRVELKYKDNWQRTRKLMFAMLKPHLKDKNTNEGDLFTFPWEIEVDISSNEIQSLEDANKAIEELNAFWEEIDRKRQQKSETKNDYDGISTD